MHSFHFISFHFISFLPSWIPLEKSNFNASKMSVKTKIKIIITIIKSKTLNVQNEKSNKRKVSWLKSLSFKLPFYNFLIALFILTFAITLMFSSHYQITKLAFLWATFFQMNIIILTWLVPCNFVHNPSVRKLEPDSWWQTELSTVELIMFD